MKNICIFHIIPEVLTSNVVEMHFYLLSQRATNPTAFLLSWKCTQNGTSLNRTEKILQQIISDVRKSQNARNSFLGGSAKSFLSAAKGHTAPTFVS